MNECEHVIVLDVCCTIKRPTTMCLAKKRKKKRKEKEKKNGLNVHRNRKAYWGRVYSEWSLALIDDSATGAAKN